MTIYLLHAYLLMVPFLYIGWTSRPKNVKAVFIDSEHGILGINITWDMPDYVGGHPVQYYKLEVHDYYK